MGGGKLGLQLNCAVDPANPQSWNRYGYVNNSPLNSVDPLGLCDNKDPLTSGQNCGGSSYPAVPGSDYFNATQLAPPTPTNTAGYAATSSPARLVVGFKGGTWNGFSNNLTVRNRDALMSQVCFVADAAVLPRWMSVRQAIDYVAGVHPRFDRAKAEGFLEKTTIKRTSKVRELSKGMVTQLHLALVMAIDAKLLLLDEPTLGLDILFRKQFYDSLLNDYFDKTRTIVVTTHQVEEIEHVLTDLMFINRGRIVLDCSMDALESRYLEVMVVPEHAAAARALKPIHERQVFGRSILLFEHADREQLAALGEVRTPGIADLFVAVMGTQPAGVPGVAA